MLPTVEASPHDNLAEMRSECIRYVVHDLNNPLTAIRLLAEFVRSEAATPDLRQDMVDILEATDLAAALIEGLASMARQDQSVPHTWLPLDLGSVLRAASERPALRRHVRIELPDGLRVNGDGPALLRAFTDILVNARRLSDRQSVIVTGEARDGMVTLRVRHEAPVSRELDRGSRRLLFDALLDPYGAVHLRRVKVAVLATGLAYARRIVEQHRGTIQFVDLDSDALDLVVTIQR